MRHLLTDFLAILESRYSIDAVGMSMSDWIEKNTSLKKKPFSFSGYSFQRAIADDPHPNMDVEKCSQVGLALDLDTPVPTTTGWTTMRDVKVGDVLYDERGQPCTVTYVSPIYLDRRCFEIEFDTGETIVADADHRWYVECHRPFNETGINNRGMGRLPKGSGYSHEGVIKTETLSRILHKDGRNMFAIPNTGSLHGHDDELPLDPYFLGLWLGDGNSASATLTAHCNDALNHESELKQRGFEVTRVSEVGDTFQLHVATPNGVRRHRTWQYDPKTATTHGILDQLGVLKNKHVPAIYLRASHRTRLDLLRGLLDTDGSVTTNGRVSFYNTEPRLVSAVEELVASLGYKFRTRWRDPSTGVLKNGHKINSKKQIAEVSFVAYVDEPVFLLPRKAGRLRDRTTGRVGESLRRRIVEVREVPTRPVRCLTVDSPNHLFLAGRGMIPTHNTEVQIRKLSGFLVRNQGTTGIFTLPNEKMFKRVSQTRIQPMINENPVFNKGTVGTRSMGLLQLGDSFLYVTGATEGDATSIPADAVFNDETDLTDQSMLALFNSRLQNSDHKISQRFSTPSFTGFGINLGYSASDQREYMCRCESCNHWNIPEFSRRFVDIPGLPDDIKDLHDIDDSIALKLDVLAAEVVCEKCRNPLDLGRADNREWVARRPEIRHARGYKVRPFSCNRIGVPYIITQLLDYKRRDYVRGWFNTVLGEPFMDGNVRLDLDVIERAFTHRSMPLPVSKDMPASIGIDVGQICHITVGVGDPDHEIEVAEFRTVPAHGTMLRDAIEEICETYNIVTGAVDRYPYTPTAEELQAITEGRIIPCAYNNIDDARLEADDDLNIKFAWVNRTKAIDKVVKMIRTQKLKFSGYGIHKSVITNHLRDMVRDEQPEKPAVWTKLSGQDHFFHSLAFMVKGFQLRELAYELKGLDQRVSFMIQGANFGVDTKPLIGSAKPARSTSYSVRVLNG